MQRLVVIGNVKKRNRSTALPIEVTNDRIPKRNITVSTVTFSLVPVTLIFEFNIVIPTIYTSCSWADYHL